MEKEERHGLSFAQRLERSPLVPLALASLLAGWLYYHFVMKRLSLDINSLNTTLLMLTLLLHRTVKRFGAALEQGAGRSWAVIVLYHLYAGVAGLIQFTAVGDRVARLAASICTAATFPLITAAAGALFACFIPSSGGQWTVQGFVTVKTAMAVGVSAQRGILALGVGDHVGNLITPFWYVVIAGIARVNFRSFFGYGVVFGLIWFVIGVWCLRSLRARLQRQVHHFFHRLHVVQLHVADLLALQIFADVDFVFVGNDDFENAAAFCGQHLFLDAADRQHLPGERDLAGHGEIAAHLAVGEHGKQRGRHGDTRARAVFGDGAGRYVDVYVAGLEQVGIDAVFGGVARGPR